MIVNANVRVAATVALVALLLRVPDASGGQGAAARQVPETPGTTVAWVAVLTFSNLTGNRADDWIGAGIAETIAATLEEDDGFSVVRDPAPSTPVLSGHYEAAATARQLGARWIVTGAYQRVGDRLRLTARVTDIETGAVTGSATVDGHIHELFEAQDRLAAELQEAFSPAGGPPGTPAVASVASETVARGPGPAPAAPEPAPSAAPVATRAASSSAGFGGLASGIVIDGPTPPVAPTTITRDADGRATVRAVRLDEPLRVNGTLNEGVYESVPPFSGFIQQRPDEGAPATERTEVWVFYDDRNVYVAARLWDSAPESQWIANEMQRDSFQLIQNEGFSVAFDTFYDRRNGMTFMVNPIGGFMDQQITDEGQPNSDWNPIWDVRTGRFPGGWTVEMEVPFKSLRFPPGEAQVWGLQLGRRIRWKNEWAYLTPVPISGGPGMFRLSAAATLTGIEVPTGNRTFEIKPYAIGSVATDLNAVPAISNDGDGDVGFDVKYGVTQNLTADFTYNTDFAQVEVDEQQVNLTRFSLFFPEKREFFLEGRGIFDFGQGARFSGGGGGGGGGGRPGTGGFFGGGGDVPTVFFSRRIGLESGQTVPILAGGRLTGKAGALTGGALNIQTDDARSVDAASTNFSVLRVKRDILRRSRIGGIFTGRSVSTRAVAPGEDPGSNQVYGLDAAFAFYDNVNFSSYWARSQTPGMSGDDASYQAAFTYNGDLYAFQVDHLLVGDNFNPEIGFLRRNDFRRTFTTAQYSPRPAIRAVRQFTWGASLDYIENDRTGRLETRLAQARFQTEFENSDRFTVDVQDSYELLLEPFDIAPNDGVSIPIGGYGFQDLFASYSMGAQRRVSGTFSVQRGEFFGGDITAVGYSRGRVEVTPEFSFEPGISINRIELPGGRFTTKLATSRVTYTFTPRMFFGGLLQYNSSRDSLSMNLRLRWEYQPGSELFVVYNDVRDTELRGTPILENRAFVVKFTRLFRF